MVDLYFSVVIPLYNKERHIKRAINSVLSQTYQKFEVIVVDDGSTDQSLKRATEIVDSRIKFIEQRNKGVSSARNTGIKHASYNYIGLLDADDMWKPNFLSVIKKMIQKYPGAGAYGTSNERVTAKGEIVVQQLLNSINAHEDGIVNYFKESLKSPVLSSSSVVIPQKIFNKLGGFPIGLAWGEDQFMWMRIALNYDIIVSNKICATYFLNADNRACNRKLEYSKSLASYAEDILIREREKGNSTIEFEEYMIKQIIINARYLIQAGRIREARKLLKKYRKTRFNKKEWLKAYLLSYKLFSVANNLKRKLK